MSFLRGVLVRRLLRRRIAKRVRACFDGVDLSRQSFVFAGHTATAPDGCATFYKSTEIDAALAKLNALLKELSA